MDTDQYVALVIVVAATLALLICIAIVVVGARAGQRFDRHVQDDLDMVAADDRNTRLDANAAWNGWY